MAGETLPLDKDGDAIQEMFSRVAPRYDLLNHLLSGSLDVAWRRRAARSLELSADSRVLDLCCGTGDQALAVRKRVPAVVTASDFCLPMLALARHKFARTGAPHPAGLAGDTQVLPLAAGSFDAVTVSFGLRNVTDLDRALEEIARVLRIGGQAVFLEFALPRRRVVRSAYQFYFNRILPVVGRLVSHRGSAYRYLPASVGTFPQRDDFVRRMTKAGFADSTWSDLSAGTVCLYRGQKGAAK
ncbi:MAG: ubiquinone/menaquinone biosynthesis methyltransferase [Acidobacteriota bacterium]|nr:ubiquinone/menaquinone biosynthesis methyltransferase [Acidobacteriota bacterium]